MYYSNVTPDIYNDTVAKKWHFSFCLLDTLNLTQIFCSLTYRRISEIYLGPFSKIAEIAKIAENEIRCRDGVRSLYYLKISILHGNLILRSLKAFKMRDLVSLSRYSPKCTFLRFLYSHRNKWS